MSPACLLWAVPWVSESRPVVGYRHDKETPLSSPAHVLSFMTRIHVQICHGNCRRLANIYFTLVAALSLTSFSPIR